jgi:hypothetical protein
VTSTVIAIVADCDDTLAPDTTAQLLRHFGVDPKVFYREQVGKLVEQGFDPSVAYLHQIINLARDGGPLAGLTQDAIRQLGRQLKFYPGIPQVFVDLEEEIHQTYGDDGIRLEEYVISGGIADLIQASPLGDVLDGIWGCNFGYDENGRVSCVKNVVSFTEKTRYVFTIEKGLVEPEYRSQPYAVNQPMEPGERRVPIRNMIYLGDGPSDIPCMSVMKQFNGYVIGILDLDTPHKTWALGYGRRANLTVPAEFGPGSHGRVILRQSVIQIAERIKRELQPKAVPTPKF